MTIQAGAVQAYIEAEFGGPTTETDSEVTVGASAQRIADNDPERLAITIFNLGANTLFVFWDETVGSTRGVLLNANGGYVNMTVRDDQGMAAREWWAVAPSGNTDVFVVATRRYAYAKGD